jgi:hypothetical protein
LQGAFNDLDSRLQWITSHLLPTFGGLVEWLVVPSMTLLKEIFCSTELPSNLFSKKMGT